ncbi:MAG: hypothetical protein RDV48_31095 [Candidatus Eremiobacteraeota bacterium]|nr:hypothetical protein [Candidatus Eremiobacteraeota bacterium]
MKEDVFDKNAGYGDAGEKYSSEIEDERLKRYPKLYEMMRMSEAIGIELDDRKMIGEENAWAYYRELKAMIEAKHRKTA